MNAFSPADSARRPRRALRAACWIISSLALLGALMHSAHAGTQVLTEVTGMDAAENSIHTTTGRIFVSSKGGLYELSVTGTAWSKTRISPTFDEGADRACYFLGLTEWQATLYGVCTENSSKAAAPKYLMALDLTQPAGTTPLREIGKLKAQGIPNGLASDGRGRLYLANLATLAPGEIWCLSLAGRFNLAVQTRAYTFADSAFKLNPNGVKYHDGKLYVSANPPLLAGTSALLRFPVTVMGLEEPTAIYTATTFLDDFGLVKGGFVLAHFLAGTVNHLSESGQLLHSAAFMLPTSATFFKNSAVPSNGLLVTLGGTDRAAIVKTDWGLSAR